MFQSTSYTGTKEKNYELLLKQLQALLEDEPDVIANLSNASSLLNQFLEDVNWVGFYLWKEDQLVLGPFQGLPACVRIPSGKGVCGTAVAERSVQRIEDVHAFPGHIACDAASQSEIVIPILKNNEIFGVLDIDSPSTSRFDEQDEKYLTKFVEILQTYV
ncbi:histidine kinase [Halobacillus halophilus]|uniref:GAF domain protein n=1 Tax=Halobacillus halophilus (strain ATCC 35676 / DSM 2266 / JCM 20832 / KCTC 3685 / LMG 17431 / NBRC 102448 / NCIMB 2269) TaxID=866895 RepID=I0JPS3_HALH3|nr:GAF domain-containing protein [Halobacillus halophilus]ASF40172.1 histidine kinase [Halobacillus halophilus]CCG46143.1 GAF domain protein [Halobacillus halophilus DSM 2266]